MSLLTQTVKAIQPLNKTAMEAARARQNNLTKPPGSLGRLEEISIQVAGITGQERPVIEEKVVITCAGDHGVVAQGISAFPQEVTPQMVYNFLNGGAAINVLARHVGARVVVVDAGVAADFEPQPGLVIKKVAHGTADMSQGPAMSREQAVQAIEAGIEVVEDEIARGLSIVATGDMGIGNTTPSSAIAAAITGLPVADVTGRGTGIDDEQLVHKVAVIEKSLAVNQPDPKDALDVLSKVGGFEIGAIAGVVLGAAAHRIPVVIDGFISTAGALIAGGLSPLARDYMIAAHASVEIGHRATLSHLGLVPCLDFDLRLGEGTGAALVINVIEAACKVLNEMATFGEAGVSEKAD
ncbi:MAG: nicotinate-nucleotide--dimethylbenzimidazole phosphoribosyltransferase [Chloroflexi bacterium]|nr:MAG: nicotinate-nucleotide--dimethylbenzimidazole phosphoribosyltransferase [Chloroflexota bacterium]